MPLAEATALLRGGEVLLAEHDPAADLKFLARIAVWCEQYSPLVGWQTIPGGRREFLHDLPNAAEPEALFLEITAIGQLFGGEDQLASQLLQNLAKRHLKARVGIADTIGAAWAASCAEHTPDGFRILPSSAPLPGDWPLSVLRLAPEHVTTLHALGVQTLEQLAALPRAGLSSRFGPGLLLRIDQASGEAEELIEPHRPPPALREEWLLEHATTRREQIEFILGQLVERLAQHLSKRQLGAVRLACRFDLAGATPLQFTVGLYRPTASARHLLELVSIQLERLRLAQAVGRVGLAAVITAPLETVQSQLFDTLSACDARSQAMLLDRLATRLGPDAVLQPRLYSTALPERASKLVPASEHGRTLSRTVARAKRRATKGEPKTEPASQTLRAPAHRPLALLPEPEPIEVIFIAAEGPPQRWRYQRGHYETAHSWGPERLETAWWRGRVVCRDYYRLEASTGQRFWVFQERRSGQWFLHGVFE
jgi:protein ImuB